MESEGTPNTKNIKERCGYSAFLCLEERWPRNISVIEAEGTLLAGQIKERQLVTIKERL